MRATIKDIAKQAGVSITTVSLVLNGKAYKIPDQTKKIVLETARELNYTPNQMAVGEKALPDHRPDCAQYQ